MATLTCDVCGVTATSRAPLGKPLPIAPFKGWTITNEVVLTDPTRYQPSRHVLCPEHAGHAHS